MKAQPDVKLVKVSHARERDTAWEKVRLFKGCMLTRGIRQLWRPMMRLDVFSVMLESLPTPFFVAYDAHDLQGSRHSRK